jgi:hypothetical protein
MNWFKKAQFTEENTQNIDVPIINIQPFEPIVQEAVNELYQENSNFFKGINKINIDTSYSQFGSVESVNPADININFNKIKSEIVSQIGNFDIYNPQHLKFLKDAIKRVIIHEKAHVQDAFQVQEMSQDRILGGEDLFPGGENVAQQAENNYF